MTDKLKCCFCGSELIPQNDIENTEPIRARCSKPGCPWFMWAFPWEIWQALIDGKKAQNSLKEISRLNQYIREELAHQVPEEASKADNSIYTITFEIAKECRKGLHNKIEEKVMTDEMEDIIVCPVCGFELHNTRGNIICPNSDCDLYGVELNSKIINCLISGKKAQDMLKVATDALSKIDTFNYHSKGAMEVIAGMTSIANGALYEITSITKGQDND